MKHIKICGPKLSLCGLVLGAWGVIQLVLMGLFYLIESEALIETLGVELKPTTGAKEYKKLLSDRYYTGAINCWLAAAVYLGLLALSLCQFFVNRAIKAEEKSQEKEKQKKKIIGKRRKEDKEMTGKTKYRDTGGGEGDERKDNEENVQEKR